MSKADTVQFIKNKSGTQLALTYTPARTTSLATGHIKHRGPILLAHGTFSNHRSMRGLSHHLSENGYECWVLDFQGHGHSDRPVTSPTFEQMCVEDAAAAVNYLSTLYPDQKLVWVGHSGGGLAALSLLAREPEYTKSFKAIVALASQTTFAAQRFKNRVVIQLSRLITQMLGYAPGKFFKLGPENEFGSVMAQWYRWSLTQQWLGDDGFDYMEKLPMITIPTLMYSGTGDTFIAPPEGCRAILNKLGSLEKEYRECGLSTGFTEDYNHSRIISSRNASKEIWPLISRWLDTL